MYPIAGGYPQVGSLFTVGGAGIGYVFNIQIVGVIAAIFLHTSDVGAAGQHLCDGFYFDIVQTADIQEGRLGLVCREQIFERGG